ncbi:hypothetical protein G9A89_007014 [Geosiphon pyriformis]|nr:hypothetical protein G9A89_007014 [Geosiphon pyriformis]
MTDCIPKTRKLHQSQIDPKSQQLVATKADDDNCFTYEWKLSAFQQLHHLTTIDEDIFSDQFASPATGPIQTLHLWRIKLTPNSKSDFLGIYLKAFQSREEAKRGISSRTCFYKIQLFRHEIGASPLFIEQRRDKRIWKFGSNSCWGWNDFCPLKSIFADDYQARNKNVDVIIRIKILNPLITRRSATTSYASTKTNQKTKQNCLLNSFTKFFDDEKLSDLLFTFENGEQLRAHRMILASRSTYFERMFTGGDWIESSSNIIPMKGVTYSTFRQLLYYLYTDEIESSFPAENLAELYFEARLRDLPDLARIAAKRMIANLACENWDVVFMLGWKHDDAHLKKVALKFAVKNWSNAVSKEKMKEVLDWGDVEAIEELLRARKFKV